MIIIQNNVCLFASFGKIMYIEKTKQACTSMYSSKKTVPKCSCESNISFSIHVYM